VGQRSRRPRTVRGRQEPDGPSARDGLDREAQSQADKNEDQEDDQDDDAA
jgi:hypothetical protein